MTAARVIKVRPQFVIYWIDRFHSVALLDDGGTPIKVEACRHHLDSNQMPL